MPILLTLNKKLKSLNNDKSELAGISKELWSNVTNSDLRKTKNINAHPLKEKILSDLPNYNEFLMYRDVGDAVLDVHTI